MFAVIASHWLGKIVFEYCITKVDTVTSVYIAVCRDVLMLSTMVCVCLCMCVYAFPRLILANYLNKWNGMNRAQGCDLMLYTSRF